MSKQALNSSADISFTEDDKDTDKSLGLVSVDSPAEHETEPYRPENPELNPGDIFKRTKEEPRQGGNKTDVIEVVGGGALEDHASFSTPIQVGGETSEAQNQEIDKDISFKKVKEPSATKPQKSESTSAPAGKEGRDSRHGKKLANQKLPDIAEEESGVSSSNQSLLDQSRTSELPQYAHDIRPSVEYPHDQQEDQKETLERPNHPQLDHSNADESLFGYRPELDFGDSVDQKDLAVGLAPRTDTSQMEDQILSQLMPPVINSELSQIVDNLKSNADMIQMDQELSSLPEFKEVAEDFMSLKYLLDHEEYSSKGFQFAMGDDYVLLLSKNQTQVHVHHIEGRCKPFVLFSSKLAKINDIHLVRELIPKMSIALISFEIGDRHFVTGKGVDEELFSWFDCKFVYEVPSRPALFRSKLSWGGFYFKRSKAHNEEPRIVLLDFKQEEIKGSTSLQPPPVSIVVIPHVVNLPNNHNLSTIIDLGISTQDGLSLAVAPYSGNDPTFGGRMIAFTPCGTSREVCLFPFKESEDEPDAVIMVEFLKQKYGASSRESFIAVEDETGYIFGIKNRGIDTWKVELLQRFSIISGMTGPNSQPLQRTEVFMTSNSLIIFRSSAFWMLAFKLDEVVDKIGVGAAQVVGQARFKTNLTYCGYSIHQTATKQAICVGRPFTEQPGNHLVQNLVGLSRIDVFKEPDVTTPENVLLRMSTSAPNPNIHSPKEIQEVAVPSKPDLESIDVNKDHKTDEVPLVVDNTLTESPSNLHEPKPVSPPRPQASTVMTGDQFFESWKEGPLFGQTITDESSLIAPQTKDTIEVPLIPVEAEVVPLSVSNHQQAKRIEPDTLVEPLKLNTADMHVGSERSSPGGEIGPLFVPTTNTQPSNKRGSEISSQGQGKNQPVKKTEDPKSHPKSKENTAKTGSYSSKPSASTLYKPKHEIASVSNQSAYVPVSQMKTVQPASTKTSSGRNKQPTMDEKDVKDKDFKGNKQRSKTPPRKNFGPRPSSTSSEETYQPKHPTGQTGASSGSPNEHTQTIGSKHEQGHQSQSGLTNGGAHSAINEQHQVSTPAFNAVDLATSGPLNPTVRHEFTEEALKQMEHLLHRTLGGHSRTQHLQTHQGVPDHFESMLTETFERVCEERLINSMKTKFECMLSNSFNEAFEELMIPVFEKYLTKVFDKTGQILDKGLRFYSDKINIEERKVTQFKDQFNQMTTQFLSQSKAFNKLCQDMSQAKKDLETAQTKELSKRMNEIEDKVDKMRDKQDTMMEILMRLDARSKQQEEEKKSEANSAPVQNVTVQAQQVVVPPNQNIQQSPMVQHQNQQGPPNHIHRQSPHTTASNSDQIAALLNALSSSTNPQRQQVSHPNIHSILPGSQNGYSGTHFPGFNSNQPMMSHQPLSTNGVSVQTLQNLMGNSQSLTSSHVMSTAPQVPSNSMYSSQSVSGMDSPLSSSMILTNTSGVYNDPRTIQQGVPQLSDAEMLDRLKQVLFQQR